MRLVLPPLHAAQSLIVNDPHRIVTAACGSKLGKMQPVDSTVYTPTGPRRMGDLAVGDTVCTPDGTSTVVAIFPQGEQQNYEIEFADGTTVEAGGEHLWLVHNGRSANKRRSGARRPSRLLTTSELIALGPKELGRRYIDVTQPVEFDAQDVPIDPYLLGLILGDGCISQEAVLFSNIDQQLVDAFRSALPPGSTLTSSMNGKDYYVKGTELREQVRTLGLMGAKSDTKFIPHCYKVNSVQVRKEVLRGILDTDGWVNDLGQAVLEQTSPTLANDVKFIVQSLGGLVRQRFKAISGYKNASGVFVPCKSVYRQQLIYPDAADLFSLARKKAACRRRKKPMRRYFESIRSSRVVESQCISLADPRGLYLMDEFAVTHNTWSLSVWLLREAWNRNQSLNWWVSPILRQARIGFNQICYWLPPLESGRVRINRGDMVVQLLYPNGAVRSTIEFRSAENPSTLRGDGVHAVVLDEAAYMNEEAHVSVTTTLTRTRGKMRIISTPAGRNWFYWQWLKGWAPDERLKNPECWSYQFPTSANPHISPEMIEQFKKNMPERVFLQDSLAQFLDDGGTVFHNLAACQTSQMIDRPAPGRTYVMGVDWAKHDDYTVFVLMDSRSKHVVHIQRHKDIDWNVNIDRAIRTAREWNSAMMIMDVTGVGDVPFDNVKAVYPYCIGYNIFNNTEKVKLIQKLQIALEKSQISIPKPAAQSRLEWRTLAETLQHELTTYGYEMSGTGKFIFNAPPGFHDDAVIALALANWQANEVPYVYRAKQLAGI